MISNTRQNVNKVVPTLEGGTGKYPTLKIANESNFIFSKADLDLIATLMRITDQAMVDEKKELTSIREMLWKSCDKDNPETFEVFKGLNRVKNKLRKVKKMRHQIAKINVKIKKLLKEDTPTNNT